MSNDARAAARSAAALAGFLIVAGLQLIVVLGALWTVLKLLPADFALRAGVPLSLATVGALGYATWRALHSRRRTPAGVAVTRSDAPELWALVDGASVAAGVPSPAGLTVVADATVVVGERTRALGWLGGRRDLYLGLPLLQAWDSGRLRAAVAHEFAHGSARLGRWAPLAYRGRVAVGRLAPRWSRGRNPAGAVFRAYAEIYRRVDAPFSRAQELAADRVAAQFAGVAAASGALRDLPVLAGMQRLFHAEYVGPGWQAGHVPVDVFGGFLRVLAARGEDVAILRARGAEPGGAWDTHPPLAERLAALTPARSAAPDNSAGGPGGAAGRKPGSAALSEAAGASGEAAGASDDAVSASGEAVGAEAVEPSGRVGAANAATAPGVAVTENDDQAAGELVPDLPGLGRALQAVAFPAQGRTEVGWDDFLSVARTAEMEREAEAALATVSRAVGVPVPDAASILELAADGRLRTAAATIFPGLTPEETAERIVDLISLMLALAALRSDVARWRHSWTGTAELVAADGAYLNLTDVAAAAADPEQAEDVRAYLARIGVDLAAPAGDRPVARAQALGGLINLSADGERTDLLVTDLGFLLVPGLSRGKGPEAKRRLNRIAAGGVSVPGRNADAVPESAKAMPVSVGSAGAGGYGSDGAGAGEHGSAVAGAGAGGHGAGAGVGGHGDGAGVGGHDGGAGVGGDGDRAGSSEAAERARGGSVATMEAPADGRRFVPFADVAAVTTLPGRRRGWVIGLRDGGTLTLRPSLDTDELPGGWAAWEEAVTFLAGTR
ncbi:M48 family metalloprotease [Actinoplanes sp. NPDC020271]|uniref:M48 family metalloprotease n=1 Tax=Actinoplanes sp. NPDC020271 TaxID=3363896 RepID=UPI0037BA66FF